MDNLGSYLKTQREERGIAIEEIASITKIHVRSLEMMEHSQWKSLPPEPFIRGFLSAYSRYVGLDPKDVLAKYQQETHPAPVVAPVVEAPVLSTPQPENVVPEPFREHEEVEEKTLAYEIPKKNHQWKIWAGASAAALLLIIVPFLMRDKNSSVIVAEKPQAISEPKAKVEPLVESGKRESVQSLVSKAIPEKVAPVVEPSKPVAPVAEAPKAVTPVAETHKAAESTEARTIAAETVAKTEAVAPVPAAATHTLVVKVKNKSWSKIVVDGTAPVQKILSADETYTYTADEKIKLVLGNTDGAEVLYNGEKVDGLKISGIIRQFVFPNNARFPQDPPKRKVATPEKAPDSDGSPAMSDTGIPKEEN